MIYAIAAFLYVSGLFAWLAIGDAIRERTWARLKNLDDLETLTVFVIFCWPVTAPVVLAVTLVDLAVAHPCPVCGRWERPSRVEYTCADCGVIVEPGEARRLRLARETAAEINKQRAAVREAERIE